MTDHNSAPFRITRIVYLHGFASNFDVKKQKNLILKDVLPVSGLTVDYTKPPKDVFETYFNFITSDPETLIIGTSLGGYFAAWLGAETGYPFIAINPAINSAVTLWKYLGKGSTYFGSPFDLKSAVIEAYADLPFRMDGAGEVMLDEGDEVLCSAETATHVGSKLPVTMFSGGSHRFDHMDQLAATLKQRIAQQK